MVVLVATVGVCAYLFLFLFHHGNLHRAPTKASATHPTPPVGASSSTSHMNASCASHSKCSGEGSESSFFVRDFRRCLGYRGAVLIVVRSLIDFLLSLCGHGCLPVSS